MIDKIKKSLINIDIKQNKGFFLSGFDTKGKILFSKGVLHTDTPMEKILDNIYTKFVEQDKNVKKNSALFVIDIVDQIFQVNNPNDVFERSPKEFGLFMITEDGKKSGVLLQNTIGVDDMKYGLYLIKNKQNLEGRVLIYLFKSTRIQVEI